MIKLYNSFKLITCILLLLIAGSVFGQTTSQLGGGIVINEVMADPNGTNNFDTDGNGVADNDDEFIELHNLSAGSIDITGWEIWDGTTSTLRHTFGSVSIPAGGYAVVISGISSGGNLSNISGDVVEEASAGFLSLNNGSEVVILYDPINDQHIAVGYNGGTAINTNFTAAHATSTLIGSVETTTDTDGLSMSRDTDGSTSFTNQTPTPGLDNTTNIVIFSTDLTSGTEAGTTVITLTAKASATVSGAQTIDVAVNGTGITGTDYTLSAAQITIPDASTEGTITLTIEDDTDLEGTEVALVTVSNPTGGLVLAPSKSVSIEITDNDLPSIIINEVEYFGTDRIELKNVSTGTVDISNYYLITDGSTNSIISSLTLESGTLSMAAGDIVVLSGLALNDTEGDLGLYLNNSDFNVAANMEYFVRWGTIAAGNGLESVAVTKGIWTSDDFVPTVASSGSTIEFDGEGFASSDWIEQTVSTLGSENSLIYTASNINDARALGLGAKLRISGEVFISFQGNSADKIYVQDATAGLLIDDNGTINTVYAEGDGLLNLTGTLVDGNGVMELEPLSDPGTANSNGNTITPVEVTITDFKASIDTYESRVIKIVNVSFESAGSTFSNFTNYNITDGAETLTFRPNYSVPDFTSIEIPYGQVDVVALAAEFNGSAQVSPYSNTEFALDVYAPEFTVAPSTSNVASGSFDVAFQANEPGTAFYVVNESATPPATAAEIYAGTSVAYTDVTGSDVTLNISGLSPGTQYYVHILLQDDESSPNQMVIGDVQTGTATTGNNDSDSDITANGGTTSNIDYASFQDASSLTDATSVSLFSFDINDKNTSDGVSTILTAITFDVTNFENIRTLALFDGTTNLSEAAVSATSVEFTGLNIEVTAGTSKTITVRATFMDVVDDQEQIQLTVTNATADGAGSSFASTDAGGAVSSIATSDLNAIEVTATAFEINTPSITAPNADFTVTSTAVDANGNTDLEARSVTLALNVGSGTLSSVTGLSSQAMTAGVFSWTDVQYNTEEDIELAVSDGAITSTSGTVKIFTTTGGVFFSEYVEGTSSNKAIEIYNNTGTEIDLSQYIVELYGNADLTAGNTLTLSDFAATLAYGETIVITNSGADLAGITSNSDITSSVTFYNGNDALVLKENGVIVDIIGEIGSNINHPVAGVADALAEHTLVRKSSILEGNSTSLGSFGTNADDSEWIVLDQNDVTNLGFHTIDGVSSPSLTVVEAITDFGSVDNGSSSATQSFTVEGANLSADITITASSNFEVSSDDATFSPSITLTQSGGTVATTTVYARFTPSTGINSAKSGSITISTTGTSSEVISLSGTETGNAALTSDLFISEYVEGSSNNKAIEIYNNSGATADLTLYRLVRYNNGSTTASDTLELADVASTLATGDLIVIANPSAAQEILDLASITSEITFYNGDDALRLYKEDQLIDEFGEVGVDPGSAWDVAGGSGVTDGGATAEFTLVRKSSIMTGNPVPLASFGTDPTDSEWVVSAQDDFSNLGFHTIDGVTSPSVTVTESLTDFGSVDNGSTSTSQSFTVEGADLTSDITITAPSNFEVSTDDATFSTSVTLTQSGGTVASTNVFVRFAPTTGLNGLISGSIIVSTSGTANQSISVSGTETGNADAVNQNFDTCLDLNGWSQFSVVGDGQTWGCTTFGNNASDGAQMSGFSGGAQDNEDWLISPALDLTSSSTLDFWSRAAFDGLPLEVKVSSDYSGSGDPSSSTWTDLIVSLPAINSDVWTETADVDLSSFAGSSVYIAFVYYSNTTDGAARWTLDDITVFNATLFTPSPGLTINSTGFISNFGDVAIDSESAASTYTLTASLLTEDLTVTVPAGFVVALDNAFAGIVGDETTPMNIPAATINDQTVTVFVKFAPTVVGTVSGNLVHSSAGFTSQNLAVSGNGTESTTTGIDELLKHNIAVYPNPTNSVLNISIPESFGAGQIRLLNLNGAEVVNGQIGSLSTINTSSLRSGVYVLQIANSETVINHRVIVK